MNNSFLDMFDADALPPEGIRLSPDQIQHAVQLSQRIPDPKQQWQAYLTAFAQIGFEQWLQERSPALAATVQTQLPSATQATGLHTLVSPLRVGAFKLCLLPMGSLADDRVTVPKAVIDTPDDTPHLYVLIEVLDEQDCVNIYGYLRHDQLVAQQRSAALPTSSQETYDLPLDWFAFDPDTLLLYLRCLDPAAISLPTPPQPAINVGMWLRDRLDDVARELSWVLLPPPALASAFRDLKTPVEQFDAVMTELSDRGIAIPSQARGAYQDVPWRDISLRLYVVTWEMTQPNQPPEWTVLFVLSTQSGYDLPINTTLRVRDEQQSLAEESLREYKPDAYLFAQVIGEQHEQFWVTIDLPNGAITLPPFRFELAP